MSTSPEQIAQCLRASLASDEAANAGAARRFPVGDFSTPALALSFREAYMRGWQDAYAYREPPTLPTREDIREALHAWDDIDGYEAADAVLALLKGQES